MTVGEYTFKMPFTPGEDEPSWANAWRQAVLDVSILVNQTNRPFIYRVGFNQQISYVSTLGKRQNIH